VLAISNPQSHVSERFSVGGEFANMPAQSSHYSFCLFAPHPISMAKREWRSTSVAM
jgi:hypothetical protein